MMRSIDIRQTPKIMKKEYRISNGQIEEENIKEILDVFTNTLEENVKEENLILFHNNISTLEVEIKDTLKRYLPFMLSGATGTYDASLNKIQVLPPRSLNLLSRIIGLSNEEYVATLNHELLHMSSTIIDEDRDIIYSGFSQTGIDSTIGIALDDGYTEILLRRLFNTDTRNIKYKYEFNITKNIEKIIGREKMTREYFTADLYSLVGDLERYSNIKAIEQFLLAFDTLWHISYGDIDNADYDDIMNCHRIISDFLVGVYQIKLDEELTLGRISERVLDNRFDRYLITLDKSFYSLGVVNKKLARRR